MVGMHWNATLSVRKTENKFGLIVGCKSPFLELSPEASRLRVIVSLLVVCSTFTRLWTTVFGDLPIYFSL